ncbi:MAG: hypothetical protein Q9208_007007 [Pyrenodesmia sp. 3 TL-2023]
MAPSPAPQASKAKPKRKATGKTDGGYKIAGTVVPWDPDIDLDRPTPTPLFPPYSPSSPTPLTAAEKAQVATFLSLRARIREGPFYTILDDDARVGKKTAASAAATFDPFGGMPTYSQKYMKKRRRLPKMSARPYVLKYFPKELWSTLDPKNHKPSKPNAVTANGTRKTKPTDRKKGMQDAAEGEQISGDEDDPAMGERDPDEEAMEEPVEDEFDEDDDDGGDYNAEQYFDDGGEDADDLDGDDEGGGGGDYF